MVNKEGLSQEKDGELALIKKYAKDWYDSYSQRRDVHSTLVITVSTYPSPIQDYKSIYPLGAVIGQVSQIASAFYTRKGISTIIAGPEGLGADALIPFAALFNYGKAAYVWLNNHSLSLITQFLLPLGKHFRRWLINYAETQRIKRIRELKPQIQINFQLFVAKNLSEDLVPFAQQLLVSAPDLLSELNKKMPHVNVYLKYIVKVSGSDNWLAVDVNANKLGSKKIYRALKQLDKVQPDQWRKAITIK